MWLSGTRLRFFPYSLSCLFYLSDVNEMLYINKASWDSLGLKLWTALTPEIGCQSLIPPIVPLSSASLPSGLTILCCSGSYTFSQDKSHWTILFTGRCFRCSHVDAHSCLLDTPRFVVRLSSGTPFEVLLISSPIPTAMIVVTVRTVVALHLQLVTTRKSNKNWGFLYPH